MIKPQQTPTHSIALYKQNKLLQFILLLTFCWAGSNVNSVHASSFSFTRFFNPAKAYTQQGNAALVRANFEAAVIAYKQAQSLLPNNPKLLNNLATALHQLEQYENAEQTYQSAITAANKRGNPLLLSQLYYNLGNHYLERNQYPHAISAYKQALTHNDKDLHTKKNLELAIARKIAQPHDQKTTTTPQQEEARGKDREPGSHPEPPRSSNPQKSPTAPSGQSPVPSQTPLPEGQQQQQRAQPDADLPTEAHPNRSGQGQGKNRDFISRNRADEILESFEERHKNFQKLYHPPTSPKQTRTQKAW